jgi:peptidoglycan/LPS O-acetylase OafA/YrhL
MENKKAYLLGGTAARLLLSLIVLANHLGSITGMYRNKFLFDADLAVSCFFILSGFAMMNSYGKLQSQANGWKAFYIQRIFRIVLPVWVLVALQVTLLFAISSAPLSQYFNKTTGKYLLANALLLNFLQQSLPGVFDHNGSNVVNGSLWTLKIEMSFYAAFPLLFLFTKTNRIVWLWILWALSIAYRLLLHEAHPVMSYQLPGQLYFFIGGMLIYHYDLHQQFQKWQLIAGSVWFIKNCIWGYHIAETVLSFPLILMSFCHALAPIDGWLRKHDYSFTIYLLHWPIIQTAVQLFLIHEEKWAALVFIFVALLLSSWLFKYLVEDKAIKLGKKLSYQLAILRKN